MDPRGRAAAGPNAVQHELITFSIIISSPNQVYCIENGHIMRNYPGVLVREWEE